MKQLTSLDLYKWLDISIYDYRKSLFKTTPKELSSSERWHLVDLEAPSATWLHRVADKDSLLSQINSHTDEDSQHSAYLAWFCKVVVIYDASKVSLPELSVADTWLQLIGKGKTH